MKKKSELTEDDAKQYEKELQDLTDKKIKEIDALTAEEEDGRSLIETPLTEAYLVSAAE